MTIARRPLIATLFVLAAIGFILISLLRGHPITKQDVGDLWGCYLVADRRLFELPPNALVTPGTRTAFTARQGKRYAYLDLARPMRLAKRDGAPSFDPSAEPTGPIEVHRSTPRALLLPSANGPPILALRSECTI